MKMKGIESKKVFGNFMIYFLLALLLFTNPLNPLFLSGNRTVLSFQVDVKSN